MVTAAQRSLAQVGGAAAAEVALDVARGRLTARRRAAVPVSEWAAEHMRTEKGEHLDFERFPHMRQPMDDRAVEKGLMCGSQVGKTTVALADVYHFCDTERVRVIYTMHTQTAVYDFSRTRAKPAIEASPHLAELLRGTIDSAEVKVFRHAEGGSSVVFFRGGQAESAAISEPADMLVHDEVDFSRPDILSLYKSRLAASVHGRRLCVGTPTIPGFGMAALWRESSQSEWLVRCPTCRDERPLTWPESIALDAPEPIYVCARGHELTRATICAGRWVDTVTEGRPTWRMYHFGRMLHPLWSAARVAAAFGEAEYTDFPELFFNQILGLPKSSGTLGITEEIMVRALVGFPALERSEQPTWAGCDQSNAEDRHRVLIGMDDADGGAAYVHVEVCGWDRLADLMHLFNIERLVIDALPETSKARELQKQFPGRVYLAYYPNMPMKKPTHEGIFTVDRKKNADLVNIDRTASLDVSARRVRAGQDSFCALPAELRKTLITEMCNMARGVETDAHGQPRAFWQNTGPDHFRHAHNYATVARALYQTWAQGPQYVSIPLDGGEREVTDEETGRTHVIRPGYIPMPEGVVGAPKPLDW